VHSKKVERKADEVAELQEMLVKPLAKFSVKQKLNLLGTLHEKDTQHEQTETHKTTSASSRE
jgi:hypothetical protein